MSEPERRGAEVQTTTYDRRVGIDDKPATDPVPEQSATQDDSAGQTVLGEAGELTEREPSWWHRDHPTFNALTGFFTGLGFVIVIPGLFAAILGWIFEYHTAEKLFPFVLVTLVVPIGLAVVPRTRRFGI